ncbi:MAG: phage major capsid protein [Oscillospiraceae bacterium]|nr:phage major capsid protein [Oscillospiraceae bacterium]
MKTLKELLELRAQAFAKYDGCKTVEEIRAVDVEIEKLDRQITEARALEAAAQAGNTPPADKDNNPNPQDGEKRAQNFKSALTGNNADSKNTEVIDKRDTAEYRQAFMRFMQTGELSDVLKPDKESRADVFTSSTDASAVIPTTILNEIIKEIKVRGTIFSLVRKLNIAGGVQIPILTVKPEAKWIGEGVGSDRQKLQANTKITFTYFGLECKVAQSLITQYASLTMFEMEITSIIVEAMLFAIDKAVISGTGSGQPLGILKETRVSAGQKLTVIPADFISWSAWKKKVFAKIPLSYTNGIFVFSKGTFDGYIDGMVDDNGQPIGRVNYGIDGSTIGMSFGGTRVVLVENDIIPDYDTAATDDVVGIYFKPSDYVINSNLEMRMVRWLDEDTNQYVDKAILICDGKMGDVGSVLLIKKGAASGT